MQRKGTLDTKLLKNAAQKEMDAFGVTSASKLIAWNLRTWCGHPHFGYLIQSTQVDNG
jgi:hypothetical protein